MKALIRKEKETITEDMGIEWIDWNTGAPLTNPDWCGGPYTLVKNYVPPQDNALGIYEDIVEPEQIVVEEDEKDYVTIDGKKYSKEELRALL